MNKYDEAYAECLRAINDEAALEEEVCELAKALTYKLLRSNTVKTYIKGRNYSITKIITPTTMKLYLFDMVKLGIVLQKYCPAVIEIDLQQDLSEEENLFELCLNMYRYKYGALKAEDLED